MLCCTSPATISACSPMSTGSVFLNRGILAGYVRGIGGTTLSVGVDGSDLGVSLSGATGALQMDWVRFKGEFLFHLVCEGGCCFIIEPPFPSLSPFCLCLSVCICLFVCLFLSFFLCISLQTSLAPRAGRSLPGLWP